MQEPQFVPQRRVSPSFPALSHPALMAARMAFSPTPKQLQIVRPFAGALCAPLPASSAWRAAAFAGGSRNAAAIASR